MANQEHVELLKQGVAVWNAWRDRNISIEPDLSHTNLSHADLLRIDLYQANLREVNLHQTNLVHADLRDADFHKANLNHATLRYADFSHADLSYADLSYADLSYANLNVANLSYADLNSADLSFAQLNVANLSNANFQKTRFGSTIFAWVDLCGVKALDTVIHHGPSTVNVNTVKLPEGETRTLFLRGVGFSDTFIDYYSSLFTAAIRYNSCFISYAHQDDALARRLYKDLQDKGVRCWFAPEDMKIGDKIRTRIDEAIHLQEKLLLLLSEHSLASSWVEAEVEVALEKERLQKCDVLFPVRLDDGVMRTSQAWAAMMRRMRHIGDFTNWQDDAIYQQHFEELLRHLKVKIT